MKLTEVPGHFLKKVIEFAHSLQYNALIVLWNELAHIYHSTNSLTFSYTKLKFIKVDSEASFFNTLFSFQIKKKIVYSS